MLRFVFSDISGKEILFDRPLTMTIRMDEKIPADDLAAVFSYVPTDELASVRLFDNGRLLFTGVVDEQSAILTEKGMNLRISARSLAAYLLDNEAMPQCYDHPSASLIYEHHVKPYGIAWEADDDATYFGEQQINKGMSRWTALKNFCAACYSSFPRITSDGILRMKASFEGEPTVFSEDGGIVYTELYEEHRRCEEISRINVKLSDDDGYRYQIDNVDAIRRGIVRERYLNAALSSTPMTCADTMLQNGTAASYEIRLKCPGRLTGLMGCTATVRNKYLGERRDLYVSGLTYRMDENGENTTLRLKRRN